MLRFFRSRTPGVHPYVAAAEKGKIEDNLAAILPLVILCLQTSLGESEENLLAVVDVSMKNSIKIYVDSCSSCHSKSCSCRFTYTFINYF